MDEKIELHAIYRKDGSVEIRDQHGREIDGVLGNLRTYDQKERVLVELELEAPHWPLDIPRATVKISIPLEVEERLPDWMVEHLAR